MLSSENNEDPAGLMAIPVAALGLEPRTQAALLTAGILTVGDVRRFGRRAMAAGDHERPLPGLDYAETGRVLDAAKVALWRRAAEWQARQQAALHAEVAAGCREAEAARAGRGREGSP